MSAPNLAHTPLGRSAERHLVAASGASRPCDSASVRFVTVTVGYVEVERFPGPEPDDGPAGGAV